MKKIKTQRQAIIQALSEGWLSPPSAFYKCGTIKLSTRVAELRHDFKIESRSCSGKTKFGTQSWWKEYRIINPSKKALAKYGL